MKKSLLSTALVAVAVINDTAGMAGGITKMAGDGTVVGDMTSGTVNAFENDGDLIAWTPEDPKPRDKKTPVPVEGIEQIALQKELAAAPAYVESAMKVTGRINPRAAAREGEHGSTSQLLAGKFVAETAVNQAGQRRRA